MPVDRTSPALRCAMWEAHEERCFHCKRLLGFGDMQIDHVIPQVTFSNIQSWAGITAALSLVRDFDPQGLENLVSSCGPCNRFKGGTPFDGVSALLPLRKAKALKARIEKRIKALESRA